MGAGVRVKEVNRHDGFERILDALNEAMLDDALWPETSALIDEACGSRGSVLTFGDEFPQDNIQIFFAKIYHRGEDRSEWLREYFRHYHSVDEHLPRLRKLPDSKIAHVPDLFTPEELKTSVTYNEGLPRFESQNGLNVRLDGPCGSRIVWALAEPVDANGWTSSRTDMVARLLPHLRQYVRVRSALAESGALGASASELLDTTRAGVIHLDRRGRIVAMNDTARELLRRNDGLSDGAGMLRTTNSEDDARLDDLLARALPRLVGQGASGSMTVRRTSAAVRLALHVKPVASREADYRARSVAALVLIADPLSRVRVEPDLVAVALGLSRAEAGVAVLLAEGRTARQIAEATGREYSTVRTHLKHIFTKLRVSRQYDVAQAVFALSRLPESRD